MEWDRYFCDIVTDPLGFPTQLSVSLYLLPVLRGRFDSNVHVTGFATTSVVRLWSKDINFTDVLFLKVRDENDKMTRQEHICTFSRWRPKPEVPARYTVALANTAVHRQPGYRPAIVITGTYVSGILIVILVLWCYTVKNSQASAIRLTCLSCVSKKYGPVVDCQ